MGVKRRLLTVLASVSMLLFVGVLLSWVGALVLSVAPEAAAGARWAEPCVAWRDGAAQAYAVMVTRSGLSLERRGLPWPAPAWPMRSIYEPSPRYAVESVDRMRVRMVRIPDGAWLGFEKGHWTATVGNGFISGPTRGDYFSVPVWFLLLAFGGLPTWWVVRAVGARRRKRRGLCRRCGYDLRATPERCPECGSVPVAPESRAPLATCSLARGSSSDASGVSTTQNGGGSQ